MNVMCISRPCFDPIFACCVNILQNFKFTIVASITDVVLRDVSVCKYWLAKWYIIFSDNCGRIDVDVDLRLKINNSIIDYFNKITISFVFRVGKVSEYLLLIFFN